MNSDVYGLKFYEERFLLYELKFYECRFLHFYFICFHILFGSQSPFFYTIDIKECENQI